VRKARFRQDWSRVRCIFRVRELAGDIYLRRAARSSGDPFFLTSCNKRMAASRSTCPFNEVFEPCRSVSLVVEPCLLPKQDNELDLELVLELVRELARELDLEMTDSGRPRGRGANSLTKSSSLPDQPVSVSRGERGVSWTWYRPFALKSVYLDLTEAGDSTAGAGPGEFVFVFGFDNRLW
jgi:hypothetical protein